MDGFGAFRHYLNTSNQMGMLADKAIVEDDLTREELLSEELSDVCDYHWAKR